MIALCTDFILDMSSVWRSSPRVALGETYATQTLVPPNLETMRLELSEFCRTDGFHARATPAFPLLRFPVVSTDTDSYRIGRTKLSVGRAHVSECR